VLPPRLRPDTHCCNRRQDLPNCPPTTTLCHARALRPGGYRLRRRRLEYAASIAPVSRPSYPGCRRPRAQLAWLPVLARTQRPRQWRAGGPGMSSTIERASRCAAAVGRYVRRPLPYSVPNRKPAPAGGLVNISMGICRLLWGRTSALPAMSSSAFPPSDPDPRVVRP